MLSLPELRCVIDTLQARRSWCLKVVQENAADPARLERYRETIKYLDGAIRKFHSEYSQRDPRQQREVFYPHGDRDGGKSSLRVLVVDDEETSRAVIVDMLEELGVKEPVEAINGPSALTLINEADPAFDLVLCDWNMPEMSGLDLLQAVRQQGALKQPSFVMVTVYGEKDHLREAIQAGVDDYIVKPVDMAVLEKKLQRTRRAS